ncbi:VanZ family protein [Metabacillus fastidiosus]|uniref:VanZ family protein n=1 Tax=Metabacillus fastidiosus TaxID=1458 RepID=UPI0008257BA1|nr:VanZ family protein [Metabacillus fastidiosus]
MRLQEIIDIVKEYFFLALIAVIVLAIIFFLGYFIGYRKLFRGEKSLPKKQLLIGGLFTGYVIMIIGVTFLNRGSNIQGMNLSFFSTYREAWYSFSLRSWQFLTLNIFMFVPFGILLPLLHSHFQRAIWTIGAALLFTISIESVQLMTGYGSFDVDDLFNNLLGAIIGYGIIMGFITIKARGIKRSFLYFSPLFLVLILFGSMFTYYQLKEFGNMSIMSTHKTDMTQATTTIDIQLDDIKRTVPVYMAPIYTKDAANKFVINFFEKINVDTSSREVIPYQNESIYWIGHERSHNIWFHFLDGSYSYTDFSKFSDGMMPKDVDEETLIKNLIQFGIHIPQDSLFQKVDTGSYEWTIDKKVIENQLIDGVLKVSYYNDDTVKLIDNRLITYDKVKNVQIKSEQEAYREILNGKFQHYSENNIIKSLHIHKVEVSYYLDSKGYYQPVYAFYTTVDGTDITILIPGI